MPLRKVILANGETYHIFNRGLRQSSIFSDIEFSLFLMATRYYLQSNPLTKFSRYRKKPDEYKIDLSKKLVKVIAYCLMPDHFHFILTQLKENGISNFIHRLTTSYSHYYNLKHEQRGPVFESRFKAVRVENQDQLIHLSRYIHLNPATGFLVEDPIEYEYSSYKIYLGEHDSDFVDPSDVMVDFSSQKQYRKFVLDQKDYQRELKQMREFILD